MLQLVWSLGSPTDRCADFQAALLSCTPPVCSFLHIKGGLLHLGSAELLLSCVRLALTHVWRRSRAAADEHLDLGRTISAALADSNSERTVCTDVKAIIVRPKTIIAILEIIWNFVRATALRYSADGRMKASGTHATDPTRDTNLSRSLAPAQEIMAHPTTTSERKTFFCHFTRFEYFPDFSEKMPCSMIRTAGKSWRGVESMIASE